MLTRAQVAKRLGRSIATVRRLEGVALHPVLDSDGIHRFDPDEVERVAERGRVLPAGVGGCDAARSRWFAAELDRRRHGLDDDDDGDDNDDEAQDEVWERREAQLARLEELAREREQELEARELSVGERELAMRPEREEMAAEVLRRDQEFRRVVRGQVSDLIDELDRLPPAVLAKILSDEDLAFLASVVKDHID